MMTNNVLSERYDSWVIAQSKNTTEQKLLKIRLRELDRERSRSIHMLNVEHRSVRRDHNKLLVERHLGSKSPVHRRRKSLFSGRDIAATDGGSGGDAPNGTSKNSAPQFNPHAHPAMSFWVAKGDDARIKARVDSWTSSLERHKSGSGLPPLMTLVEDVNEYDVCDGHEDLDPSVVNNTKSKAHDDVTVKSSNRSGRPRRRSRDTPVDPVKPHTISPSIHTPMRSSHTLPNSNNLKEYGSVKGANNKPDLVVSPQKLGESVENTTDMAPSPAKTTKTWSPAKARNTQLTRRMSRLKMLAQVPTEFDIRAKTASVVRSGKPKIGLNAFQDHHHAKRGEQKPQS